jgi:HEAT repeat protein
VHNPAVRKSRRILLITLLIAAVGTVSWLLLRPDPEPTYQGKPLTYWLDIYGAESSDEAQLKAAEAMRQIGTNTIPTLLRMLNAKDSRFKLSIMQLAYKQHLIKINWRIAQSQNNEALIGFTLLGPQGKSAVPALIEIYNERRPGPHNDPAAIAGILASMGPAATDAVPRLVRDTTDADSMIRFIAVWTLGKIHARPDLAVPALTASLRDPEIGVRGWAPTGLGAFGTDAKSAVPDLIKALADPDSDVRNATASALKNIDPEAAAKAGVK